MDKATLTEAQALAIATHRHYKDGLYRVIDTVRHSETEEYMVLYEQLWPKERSLWVRPLEMFHGKLEDGRVRFLPLVSADTRDLIKPT